MKEHGSPISLFSFQDIVTSLTGIMIIVILVIALQMIETMQEALQAPPPPKEYTDLQEQIKGLRSRLAALKEADSPLPEEWAELLENKPEDLASIRKMEEERQKKLEERIVELKRLFEVSQGKLKSLNDKIASIEMELEQLGRILEAPLVKCQEEEKELEKKVADLKKECDALADEENKLVNAVAANRKKLEFAFVGPRTHTPILIECKGDGFTAGVYLSKDVRSFTDSSFRGNLNSLCKWLDDFNFSRYYPVLLYRESAIRHANEIEEKIQSIDRNMKIGKDPISSDVVVF